MSRINFNRKKFINIIDKMYQEATELYPKLEGWSFEIKLWEDGDFEINLFHREMSALDKTASYKELKT